MDRRTLTNRVKTLEKAVEDIRQAHAHIDSLEARTQTLDVQFAQFHSDVRLDFSAVHEEITAGFQRVDEDFVKVREEIRQGDEETRRFMRVLHEDLVGRIAVLGEQFRRT